MSLILHPDYQLYERRDTAFCSSLQIAQEFGKSHAHVLRDIQNLDCSQNFNESNFGLVKYTDEKGEKRPMFLITKNGFIFLVMGYRGKKAAIIKEGYIKRFDDMEKFIRNYILARDDFAPFTQAIADSHEEPKSYHYSNEMNMINSIVLGMNAKQFKELHGLGNVPSIRPFLTEQQAKAIRKLQTWDIRLLYRGVEYPERKETLAGLFREKFPALGGDIS